LIVGAVAPALWASDAVPTVVETRTGQKFPGPFTLSEGILMPASGPKLVTDDLARVWYGAQDPAAAPSGTADSVGGVAEILALASAAHEFIDQHSDASGIVLRDEMTYTYRPEGAWTLRMRMIGLVLKEEQRRWADQVGAFTEGRDRVKYHHARCILPDGTVLAARPEDATITKPQMSPGMFITFQLTTLRIPGVEVGAIVDVDWEVETYNPYHKEFFFPVNYFQSSQPIYEAKATVTIPADRTLFWETRNMAADVASPTITEAAGTRTYAWAMHQVPPLKSEPLMPKGADAMPYLQASLFEGWDKIHDWINSYWKPNTTPSPELASTARELTAHLADEDAKVAAIYHWVQKNIRYIIIKSDAATLYGSYPAHETVAKQFGCCVDKAMVFSAMLNAIGVENGPLLINVESHRMSPRIPNLSITHSISRITRSDGRKFYLDATGYDFRYPAMAEMNEGEPVVDPFARSFDVIPLPPPEQNLRQVTSTLRLRPDGSLKAVGAKRYTGTMEAGVRGYFKSMKPTEREQSLRRRINDYGPSARLATFTMHNLEDISQPFWYDLVYELPQYPRLIADLAVMPIPGLLEALSFPETALGERIHPIQYHSVELQIDEGELILPAGWHVRSLPEPLTIKNEWLEFHGSFTAGGNQSSGEPEVVTFRTEFRRTGTDVPVSEYARFKADTEKIKKFGEERIFLTRPDVEVKP
jgi:hypothetical protein